MKSERAAFFDEAIVSGPGQKEFEERIYAESQAKHWPRVPEGTGRARLKPRCSHSRVLRSTWSTSSRKA